MSTEVTDKFIEYAIKSAQEATRYERALQTVHGLLMEGDETISSYAKTARILTIIDAALEGK